MLMIIINFHCKTKSCNLLSSSKVRLRSKVEIDLVKHTVDSAYNIHGYKSQPVIVATKIMSQNPH